MSDLRVLSSSLAALAVLLGCGCTDERPRIAVPQLGKQPIELRVAHVINPRLPQLDAQHTQLVLDAAQQAAKDNFGIEVRFVSDATRSVDNLFRSLHPRAANDLRRWIYHPGGDADDRPLLRNALLKQLRKNADDLAQTIAYAQPFLLEPLREATLEALADALVGTHLVRFRRIQMEKAADARPLLDGSDFNQYIYWDAVAYMDAPYEVIVTNQLMASVEREGGSVHSAIRGGITNGVTTANPRSRLQTTAILSVYPFIGEDALTRELRGGETYSPDDAARFAGFVLAHEVGHQLLHLGHPYGQKTCVMNPPVLLRFREWVAGLSAANCPITKSGPMAPGGVKFYASVPL